MAELHWCLRTLIKQSLLISILLGLSFIISPSEAETFHEEVPSHDDLGTVPSSGGFPYPEEVRLKRNTEKLHEELKQSDFSEGSRDKKAPRKFLGLRGKKAPSSFLGMRGRREDPGAGDPEEELSYGEPYEDYSIKLGPPLEEGSLIDPSLEAIKRVPSAFLGMRGKKAPSAFLGMRGKKAPSAFLGMRGKKAPSSFLGMRGKKIPSSFLGMRGKKDYAYDELEDVLQALRNRYNEEELEEEKRAPRQFFGLRGKKFDSVTLPDEFYPRQEDYVDMDTDSASDITSNKRAPSAFLGMRG